MKYELEDCIENSKKWPETFKIDDSSVVKPGDFVKLVFVPVPAMPDMPGGERMWVRVIKVEGDQFEGLLDNDPILFPPDVLHAGSLVKFERRHIANVMSLNG